MDQLKRDQILDEITGSKLTAEVAVAARNDEICEHLKSIIDELNLPQKIDISPTSSELIDAIPRIKMTMESDDNSSYPFLSYLEFDYVNEFVQPCLNIENLAYRSVYAGNRMCMMLKAMSAIADKLDSICKHVNSDIFKSYEADIKAYVDAGKSLKKFDEDAHEEKIKQTVLDFRADQVLKDSKGTTHLIRKVTNKRLWLSNWHYYNGAVKQSECKELIARWIVDGSWTICV